MNTELDCYIAMEPEEQRLLHGPLSLKNNGCPMDIEVQEQLLSDDVKLCEQRYVI